MLQADASTMSVPLLSAPGTFTTIDIPLPPADALNPGQALVRVLAGGICGSDLPYFRGAPLPAFRTSVAVPAGYPMHEIVGEIIAERPVSDTGLEVGTLVVGWAIGFDGLAPYLVTELDSLAPYPASLAPADAVLLQPLACVLYAVERIGDVTGRTCAVLGLGPIGLMFAHVLKQRGAARVIGVDRVDRSDVAADFGVDELHWSSTERWAEAIAADQRPHVVVEAIGHQVTTLQHALEAVEMSGTVFYFGVNDDRIYPLDMERMLRRNLTLMAGGTLDRRRMLLAAGDYLTRHPHLLEASVTNRLSIGEVQRAYELAASPSPGRLKVVVTRA